MTTFIQLLTTGLMMGTLYGLAALGFVLIYKSSKIFNFAQGEFILFGLYLGWSLTGIFNLPLWLAVLVTLVVVAFIGYGLERFPLRPMIGQPPFAVIMVTLGIAILLRGFWTLVWSPYFDATFPLGESEAMVTMLGIQFPALLLIGALIAVALAIVFGIIYRYSRAGLHMRAAAENSELAQSMGIRVTKAIAQSWAISFVISAAVGIIFGLSRGVTFAVVSLGLIGMLAALTGGLESILGAMVGGLIIGVFQSLGGGYIGHGFKEIAPYVAILFVILLRPDGLFGLKRIERV
jgi:branched-chain amino acid transport system permease protein